MAHAAGRNLSIGFAAVQGFFFAPKTGPGTIVMMPDHDASPETRTTLIRRVCELNPAAWAEFVELYDELLRKFIRSFGVAGEADCEDIKQEILLKLCLKLHTFKPEMAFRTWLWQVARNAVIDSFRRQQGRRKPAANESEPNAAAPPRKVAMTPEIADGLADDKADAPDQEIIRAHDRKLFGHVMEKVKAELGANRKWACFEMRYVQIMPSRAVAEKLEIKVGLVDQNTYRVLQRIRELCKYYDIEL